MNAFMTFCWNCAILLGVGYLVYKFNIIPFTWSFLWSIILWIIKNGFAFLIGCLCVAIVNDQTGKDFQSRSPRNLLDEGGDIESTMVCFRKIAIHIGVICVFFWIFVFLSYLSFFKDAFMLTYFNAVILAYLLAKIIDDYDKIIYHAVPMFIAICGIHNLISYVIY